MGEVKKNYHFCRLENMQILSKKQGPCFLDKKVQVI